MEAIGSHDQPRGGRLRGALVGLAAGTLVAGCSVAAVSPLPISGPLASPARSASTQITPSAQLSPSYEAQPTGSGGPALATGEQIVDMRRTAAGGWILTPVRLVVTDGSSWRDCWLSGDGLGRTMPSMDAIFVDGVIHARLSTTLWTSADGCASWSESSFPVDPVGLAFPTDKVGYIIGGDKPLLQNPNATIFKTEDGGLHWTATGTVRVSDSGAGPMMSFADALHGWITDGATVWTTTDGGVAWSGTALPKPGSVSGALSSLSTSDAGDGSAVIAARYDTTFGMGGVPLHLVFYRTVDFGAHWNVASVLEVPETGELSLVDSKTWVVLDPSEPATVRTTADAGSTWQTIAVRERWPFDASGIDFADALHGWLVVSEPYPSSPQPSGSPALPILVFGGPSRPQPEHLVVTDDGGATWNELTP